MEAVHSCPGSPKASIVKGNWSRSYRQKKGKRKIEKQKRGTSQERWSTLLFHALRRQREADFFELKLNLDYIESSRKDRNT